MQYFTSEVQHPTKYKKRIKFTLNREDKTALANIVNKYDYTSISDLLRKELTDHNFHHTVNIPNISAEQEVCYLTLFREEYDILKAMVKKSSLDQNTVANSKIQEIIKKYN